MDKTHAPEQIVAPDIAPAPVIASAPTGVVPLPTLRTPGVAGAIGASEDATGLGRLRRWEASPTSAGASSPPSADGRSRNPLAERLASASDTVERPTIRRTVTVDGVTDPATHWENVKDLVEKVYRRKKTLFEWSESGDNKFTGNYEGLALALDAANQSKASMGRSRPSWAPGIRRALDETWGGKRHRRHILMSSLLRDAVYAVTDRSAASPAEKLKNYNDLIAPSGFSSYDNTSLPSAEAALVYVLHNNPANLELDMGAENSAIGSFAHSIDEVLHLPGDKFAAEAVLFAKDRQSYLEGRVKGFQMALQFGLVDTVVGWEVAPGVEGFRDFMEMLYDNTAVDVLTKQKLPPLAPRLLDLYKHFVKAESTADLGSLLYGSRCFIAVGLEWKPSKPPKGGGKAETYASIWT